MKSSESNKRWKRPLFVIGIVLGVILVGYAAVTISGSGKTDGEKSGGQSISQKPAEKVDAASGEGAPSAEKDSGDSSVPGTIEHSLLGYAEAGKTDGSRYVSFESSSGLWAFSLQAAFSKARHALRGEPIALGKKGTKLTFHPSMVAGRCIYAVLDAESTGRLFGAGSSGEKGNVVVDAGSAPLKMVCLAEDLTDEAYRLSLSAAALGGGKNSSVNLRGLWLVPQSSKPPAGPAELESCGSGKGWAIQPGSSLLFTLMSASDRRLEMEADGPGVKDLLLTYGFDGGKAKPLPVTIEPEKGKAQGFWMFPEGKDPAPVQVEVSLPENAGGEVCLGRLSVLYPGPAPVVTGKLPQVEGVVFILIDTLRADVLSFIDASSAIATPRWKKLAGESVVFTRATAHSHYTKPSMGTIFTGVYSYVHGSLAPSSKMLPSVPLITEMLDEEGVDTQGIYSNIFLNNRKFGFVRGWKDLACVNPFKACVGGELVAEKVETWAEAWEPGGRFFVYIHLMDPHAPYSPPADYEIQYVGFRVKTGRFLPLHTAEFLRKVRRGEEDPPGKEELGVLRSLYNADVAHSDLIFGKILDVLEEKGILDRALLIVTSDHGEEFMEHGMLGHATCLHKELVHVPLLMRWPGGAVKGTVKARVGHIDLPPTILDVFEIPAPASMKYGRDLVGLMKGEDGWQNRAYLIEHKNESEKGVVMGDWRLLDGVKGTKLTRIDGSVEKDISLFDYPITWRFLRLSMVGLMAGADVAGEGEAEEAELSKEEIEKLKAIGYIL